MSKNVVLYKFDTCPFCRKVMFYLEDKGIEIPMKDTMTEPGAREELVAAGGKGQVPALMIDGVVMYESDAIIQWFEENWS